MGEQKLLLPHQPCCGIGKRSSVQSHGAREGWNMQQQLPAQLWDAAAKEGELSVVPAALQQETFRSDCPKRTWSPGREDPAWCWLLEAPGSQ